MISGKHLNEKTKLKTPLAEASEALVWLLE
jgi:hypothetical protein